MKKVLSLLGRRGMALLFFALLDVIYAFGLFCPSHPMSETQRWVASVAPLPAWGTLWLAVGLALFFYAFRRNDVVGFALAIGLKMLWGVVALIGWFAGVDRSYLSAAIWLAAAGFVGIMATWPDPSRGRQTKWTPP